MTCRGLQLANFLPLRRPQKLLPTQTRIFKKESDVRSGGREDYKMAFVSTADPPAESLECPVKRHRRNHSIIGPPLLITCIDQGSVGWQATLWLYQKVGLQGWWVHDPWHRSWNDLRLSIVASGLWGVVREMILCMNHRAGPWERASFFQQTKASMEQMRRYSDCENPFFLHFYPEICKDLGIYNEPGFGTKPHLEKVWQLMLTDRAFKHKGQKVRWGRWCSFFDCGEEFIKQFSLTLPAMCSHGVKAGWWKSVEQSPLLDTGHEDLAIAGAVAAVSQRSGGLRAPRGVKESNDAVQALRLKCKNAFHLTTTIMTNLTTKRLFASLFNNWWCVHLLE
eukprot:1026635-Amphidinium_carterae.4